MDKREGISQTLDFWMSKNERTEGTESRWMHGICITRTSFISSHGHNQPEWEQHPSCFYKLEEINISKNITLKAFQINSLLIEKKENNPKMFQLLQ